jgi:hypothetical protein
MSDVMNILFLNFGIGGFAGDASQFLLLVKGLMELGHKVVVVVPDGDAFYWDEAKSKSYAPIRKKLLEAKGEYVEIEGKSMSWHDNGKVLVETSYTNGEEMFICSLF